MKTVKTLRKDAHTFLTHLFGSGLEDERYAVERFRSMDDGDIRPLPAGGRTAKGRRGAMRVTASRRAVRQMRPARDEIIVCTALNLKASGVQYWGEAPQRVFLENAGSVEEHSPGDVPPATRRPDAVCIPATGGRRTSMPHARTPVKPAPMSVSATADAPQNATTGACAWRAARHPARTRPQNYAPPAERGGASPNAPATPGAKQQGNHTAAGNLRAAVEARGRGASGADMDAAGRVCARAAVTLLPPGEAPSVNPVARRGERPSGNSTPRGEPPACAGGAASRLSRALRSAAPAPRSVTGATGRRRTPPAGGVTPDRRALGLCPDCGGQSSEGAARCEPCARRSYVSSGEHRGLPLYPPRYTVVELATGGGPRESGTVGRRWPCASPSRSSLVTKSR